MASRFHPILKITWLACKRNGLPRDLRRVICNLVSRHAFDWETEQLREERAQRWNLRCVHQASRAYYLCRRVEQVVEKWQKLPYGAGEDGLLHLQRVQLRLLKYSPPSPYWRWLH